MSKFKAGDWVRYTMADNTKAIGQVLSIDDNFIHIGINDIIYYRFDLEHPISVELWRPEVGEWCIYNFDLGDTTIPIFISPRLDSFGHMYAKNPITHEVSSIMFDDDWLCDCEPFIGELPTSLQH
jgi:hypothetical protein